MKGGKCKGALCCDLYLMSQDDSPQKISDVNIVRQFVRGGSVK